MFHEEIEDIESLITHKSATKHIQPKDNVYFRSGLIRRDFSL